MTVASERTRGSRRWGGGRPPFNVRTLISPRRAVQLLFAPKHGLDDRVVGWVGVARTVAGIALWAALASPGNVDNVLIAGSQPLVTAVRTLYLGPFVVVVVVFGAVLFASPGMRGERFMAAVKGPVWTILLAVGIMWLVVEDNRHGLGQVQHWHHPPTLGPNASASLVWRYVELFTLEVVYVWLGVYVVCALYYMNRNMFNAADVNPQLVPVAAIVFVWALVIYDSVPALQRVIPQLQMGVPVPMSSNGLRFTLAAGGATVVTLLALWELKRIRDRAAAEGGNMTTPPLLGSWQAQNPHLRNPTPPEIDQQMRSGETLPNGTYGTGRPLPEWWADYRARQAAWRRRWRPVLLWVAIIFGVLSFLAVSLARR